MPIDYKEYHPEWKTKIRPDILQRDNNCCKFCGVENKSFGYRDADGKFYPFKLIDDALNDRGYDYFSNELKNCYDKKGNPTKGITIVLTIAHLDHDKTNNDYENLAALCQKCHLGIDLKHHMKNARETNRKKKKLKNLFNESNNPL